jgi:hypothetical protein
MALMSGKIYSDAGTPSNSTGENGDIFMQLDGLKTTYRKEGGAWTAFGNQLGTIPEFLKGIGAPSNAVGEDGQYYREVNTDAIYQKDAGVWTNIGSWTSLEIQQLLLSNGIGANLSVTNHVSNIDAFTEAGAEGYFDNTTTGTKPDTYGLVKVWRESSTYIYQKAQTSNNKWATRYSSNGATTWLAWRVTASQDGDNTRKFKALAGVADDDVAVVGQLPAAPPELFGSTYNYLATGETLTIPPLGSTRVILIGGGGGGSTYEGTNGGDGTASKLTHLSNDFLVAKGGLGAYAGYGVPSGNGDQPHWPQGEIITTGQKLDNMFIITKNTRNLNYLASQGYGAEGLRDPSQDYSPNVVRTGRAGAGADIEFLIYNPSNTDNLTLVATVGVGGTSGGGSSGAGAAGVIAYRS